MMNRLGSKRMPIIGLQIGILLLIAGFIISCSLAPPFDPIRAFSHSLDSLPLDWKEEPVIVLADTVTIQFQVEQSKNRAFHHQSTWYRVNRRQPGILEQIVLSDFQSIENLPRIQVTAYFPNGDKWRAGQMDIARKLSEQEGIYSSNQYVSIIHVPQYQAGMLLHIQVDREYYRPEFLNSELVRSSFPALTRSISLSLPKGADIKHNLINPESLVVKGEQWDTEKTQTFGITAVNLPKIEVASTPRNPETWFAGMHFSFPAEGFQSLSWSDLGRDYRASIVNSFKATPELEKIVQNLSSENPDTLTKQIYGMVRNRIRYHADLGTLYSFIPRTANEVFTKGYGDCKEMATLLTTLLQIKGIHAGVALVATPGYRQVLEGYPSMGGFNHMIVYVEGKKGEIHFFDPTVKWGDPANSYYDLLDRTAFVLKEGESQLKVITMGKDYLNRVETKSNLSKSEVNNNWNRKGIIRLEGYSAFSMIPFLDNAHGEETMPLLKSYLKEMFSVEASSCRVDAVSNQAIEISYEGSFNANYLTMDKGGLNLSSPSLYGGDMRFSSIKIEGPRYVYRLEQKDNWEVPAGFEELEKVDLDHALGKGKWIRKGNSIQRSFESVATVLPPDNENTFPKYIQQKNRFVKGILWHR